MLNVWASWKLEIALKLIRKLGAIFWLGSGKPGGDDGLVGLAGRLAGGGERRGEGGPLGGLLGGGGDSRPGDGAPDEELAARSPRSRATVWTPATT